MGVHLCFPHTAMVYSVHTSQHRSTSVSERSVETTEWCRHCTVDCLGHQPLQPDCQTLSDGNSLPTYHDSVVVRCRQKYWNVALHILKFGRSAPLWNPPHRSRNTPDSSPGCTNTSLCTDLPVVAANRAVAMCSSVFSHLLYISLDRSLPNYF